MSLVGKTIITAHAHGIPLSYRIIPSGAQKPVNTIRGDQKSALNQDGSWNNDAECTVRLRGLRLSFIGGICSPELLEQLLPREASEGAATAVRRDTARPRVPVRSS